MQWRSFFQENVIKGSEQFIKKGAVQDLSYDGKELKAVVRGMEDFCVTIETDGQDVSAMECSCPLSKAGHNCKHMSAVLLFAEQNDTFNADGDDAEPDPATESAPEIINEYELQETEKSSEDVVLAETPDIVKSVVGNKDIKEVISPIVADPAIESGDIKVDKNTEILKTVTNDDTVTEPVKENLEVKKTVTYNLNWPFERKHDPNLTVTADVTPIFAFSVYQNGTLLVDNIVIKNSSENQYKNLVIRVYSDYYFFDMDAFNIGTLGPNESYTFKGPSFHINGRALKQLSEKVTCNLYVCITYGQEEYARVGTEINVLAINQWPGVDYDPVLLASFITPNHPIVSNLLFYASSYLERQTGDPSITGYQLDDKKRIMEQATAAYAAIQMKNIRYATAPAGFIHDGQKIRFADEMMAYHMGNCMDMSLLYVACLEQMGLNPLLVLVDGHIFSGVWLINCNFTDSFTKDPSLLEKKIELGELIVVESTSMCSAANSDKPTSFDEAMIAAKQNVANYSKFRGVLDIRRARKGNIKPMPLEKRETGFFELEHKDLDESNLTELSEKELQDFSFDDVEKEVVTKQIQWERKLLDLGVRNPLISISKKAIPLLASGLAEMEDAFSDNIEYKVCPIPEEWTIRNVDAIEVPETRNQFGEYFELIKQEVKNKRLHAIWDEKRIAKELDRIYKETKDAMAESGANTLYLVLGELRWVEYSKPYYAPIILIPIEMIRKSANEGYVIRGAGDETQVNITLLEFLKQKFNLEIPGLNPPPMDEHGVDVAKIFAMIRSAIIGKKNWDILENAYIGNFSFTQFVMWNDIHTHPEMLRRSPVVQALMDGEVEWNTYMPSIDQKEQPYLAVNVDESQLRAVNMAANDVSFVLHGPPGAGKSQTITAMISNALTRGKTVLFVAEKPAALNVVKNRLDAIGIGDFCIEIHSNKIKKSRVLEQFKQVREKFRVLAMSTNYDEKIGEICERRESLNEYGIALHKKRNFGLSVREMIDEYEMVPAFTERIKPSKELIKSITVKDFEKNTALLDRLVAAGKVLGHPHNHMFLSIGQTVYSKSLKVELSDAVSEFDSSIKNLISKAGELASVLGESTPVSKTEWDCLFGVADAIIRSEEIPEWLLRKDAVAEAVSFMNTYISKRDMFKSAQQAFYARYKDDVLSIDLSIFVTKYAEAERKIFGKSKAIEAVSNELGSYTHFQINKDMITTMSAEISSYKESKREYESFMQSVPAHLKDVITENLTIDEVAVKQQEWENILSVVENYSAQITMIRNANSSKDALAISNDLLNDKKVFEERVDVIESLLLMKLPEDAGDWIGKKKEKAQEIEQNYSKLRDWINFQEVKTECISNNLEDICELYLSGLEHEKVVSVYKKSVLEAIIWDVISDEPVFDKFTGNTFNESIREYRKLEDDLLELTKKEIIYKLSHNIPTGHESSKIATELKFLTKAITSGGRGLSIRGIFDKAPNVTRMLCPCFLMSPLSVAQFISPDSELFDIVMFDEASQIRTCEAVGSLSRGKNAVIVGDPKQMPPTSFFMGDTFDEDNVEIEDLDSILDDCLTLGMPETHLRWHYRSRHESLIAFSNQKYYDNSMLTFPSVNDRERRVKLCTVNGVFKSGKDRTNEKEAQAIISEVLRRFNEENLRKYSIGIVTFNETQRKLIESLLEIEYQKNPELDSWANREEEPLIVRNLENVQGDERDIILFSVTYGLDEERYKPSNFGPLNQEGGWRRLNVAISRAKYEIILFSSLTHGMITNTTSRGVEGLRDFLKFAELGYISDSSTENDFRAKGILKSICEVLDKNGYSYQCNVGHSKFKLDIAVVNPFDENEYLLGIMLDGDTYKASLNNTKDREISQIEILKGLGWKIHRIWTMDWWDNKDQEVCSLLDVLDKTKEEVKNREGQIKDFDYCPPSEKIDEPNTAPRTRKKSDSSERKKRYVKITGMDATNRFTKKVPIVLVLEDKVYESADGDFFRVFKGDPIPVISMAFDNYAVYNLVDDNDENYLLAIDEKAFDRIVSKVVDEDITQEIAEDFHEAYPEIETKAFLDAFMDSRDKESVKKRFKTIRPSLSHVKEKDNID